MDLADFDEETAYAMYDSFGVANEQQKYRLQLGQYTGKNGCFAQGLKPWLYLRMRQTQINTLIKG